MEIKLREKPQGCTIIEGFPGLGLIGTIATEYLIKHLDAKSIGYIWSEDFSPIATVHDSKVIQPFEIYYAKKKNLVIVHSMIDPRGMEWQLAEILSELYKQLKATELISLEGILGQDSKGKGKTFYYSNSSKNMKKLSSGPAEKLREGIIMGVTAALLLREKKMVSTGVFVETHSKLPDSLAASEIIRFLNEYLSLKIDVKPLQKAAEEFESKMREYVSKVQEATKKGEESHQHPGYVG